MADRERALQQSSHGGKERVGNHTAHTSTGPASRERTVNLSFACHSYLYRKYVIDKTIRNAFLQNQEFVKVGAAAVTFTGTALTQGEQRWDRTFSEVGTGNWHSWKG